MMRRKHFQSGHGEMVAKVALLVLSSAVLLISGCGEADGENKDKKTVSADAPKEKISEKVEALTGNHSRLAWLRYVGETADVYGNGNQHQLWGLDSRDGRGVRVIVEKKSNYSRPLISPDGKWIIYTNKHTERQGKKKSFKPVVHRVDWNGEQGEELGKGFAVDVWEDPRTSKTWVYVANLISTNVSSMYADKLERFQLDDPGKRELVWKKTRISVDNIQLSDDGKRAACLFPWPYVGVIDLEKKEYWRNQHGCWPSLAPDNSYAAWVFDGSHKSLHMFADRGKKLSVVKINDGPGMGGREMYHPRWSNHPRFITVTGPYKGRTIGKSGKHAEVYIGKFSKTLKSIDSWIQVTDDSKGDHYPDLWVKDGDKVSLGEIGGGGGSPQGPEAGLATSWPSKTQGLLYLWENAKAQNQISAGESQRACGVRAHQRARFGRHFEMLTGGGYFEVDSVSAKAMDRQLLEGGFAFQLRLSSTNPKQAGVILSHKGFQLRQEDSGELILAAKDGSYSMGRVNSNEALDLAASFQDGKWTLYRDGNVLEMEAAGISEMKKPVTAGLVIGDGKWDGQVEGLAIYSRALSSEEVAKSFAYWQGKTKSRSLAHRVKLRGKLVEITAAYDVESLDAYRRALLAYAYEIEKVIEGKYAKSKVIVYHWSIMDRKPLSGIPRKLGQSYTLEIEPYHEHPQLEGERRFNDLIEIAEEYFDVTTPQP